MTTTDNEPDTTADDGDQGEQATVLFRLRVDERTPTVVHCGLFTGPDEEHLARRGTLNLPCQDFEDLDAVLRYLEVSDNADRRLAAVLAKTGPVWVTDAELEAVNPDELVEVPVMDPWAEQSGTNGSTIGLRSQFGAQAEPIAGPAAKTAAVFSRAGTVCEPSIVHLVLAEIADKAAGTLQQVHEAMVRDAPSPDPSHVAVSDLLMVTSALLDVLGYESTPVGTEVIAKWKADNQEKIAAIIAEAEAEAQLRAEDEGGHGGDDSVSADGR